MSGALVEGWTEQEQGIARAAFDLAYSRAIDQLVLSLRIRSSELNSAESIWALHDFLSIQRHSIEGRFDFRFEGILFVFASLVKDNLLQLEDLEGLDREKLTKISAMARF